MGNGGLVKTLRNPGLVLIRQKFDFRSHWRATRVAAALGSLRSLLCAKSGHSALQRMDALFDHLVGAGEQRSRHVNAERLGGLEVDG